jgi:uncharacterized protein YjbJ (UPF0337 family)
MASESVRHGSPGIGCRAVTPVSLGDGPDAANGTFHEAKGTVKETVGRATNNPDLEAEGQDEKIGGRIQKKIGQVEKVLGKEGEQRRVARVGAVSHISVHVPGAGRLPCERAGLPPQYPASTRGA